MPSFFRDIEIPVDIHVLTCDVKFQQETITS